MQQGVQWPAEQLVPRAVGIVVVEVWTVLPLILVRVVRAMKIPILVAVEVVVEDTTEGVVVVAAVVAAVVDQGAVVAVANSCTGFEFLD
jgi:hypothetical protein